MMVTTTNELAGYRIVESLGLVRGGGQEFFQRAGQRAQPPVNRGRDPRGGSDPVGADVDQPAPLGLILLGERVRQR